MQPIELEQDGEEEGHGGVDEEGVDGSFEGRGVLVEREVDRQTVCLSIKLSPLWTGVDSYYLHVDDVDKNQNLSSDKELEGLPSRSATHSPAMCLIDRV